MKLSDFTFTRQETRILPLLAQGLPHKVIADQVKLSTHTVEFHLMNIRRKVGKDTTMQAAVFLAKFF